MPGETGPAGPIPEPQLSALGFHNPIAVRVGLIMASTAALLSWMPLLGYGIIVWQFSAGFLSVVLYHRRTGQSLSVRAGARLGWITGVFSFVIATVLFTLSIVTVSFSKGGLSAVFTEQLRGMAVGDQNVDQAIRILETPAGLAAILLFSLFFFFAVITTLCVAGGALGAKIASKD